MSLSVTLNAVESDTVAWDRNSVTFTKSPLSTSVTTKGMTGCVSDRLGSLTCKMTWSDGAVASAWLRKAASIDTVLPLTNWEAFWTRRVILKFNVSSTALSVSKFTRVPRSKNMDSPSTETAELAMEAQVASVATRLGEEGNTASTDTKTETSCGSSLTVTLLLEAVPSGILTAT